MYIASCWLALSSAHARRVWASSVNVIVRLSALYWPPNDLHSPWPLAFPCTSKPSASDRPDSTGTSAPTAPNDSSCHCVVASSSAAGGSRVGAWPVPNGDASASGEQAATNRSAAAAKVIRMFLLAFIPKYLQY